MTVNQPWRSHLKPDEQTRIAELDRIITEARETDRINTTERELIRRRAVQRHRKAVGL